jgi:hypothetical protein
MILGLANWHEGIADPESESAEPAEAAIARVAVSLTGKERACTLLSQIGESFDETG